LYPLMPVELLAFHDRSTVCWSVAPVPLAVSEAVPPPLTNARLADTVPAAVEAKVTVNARLCPEAIVAGNAVAGGRAGRSVIGNGRHSHVQFSGRNTPNRRFMCN